MHRLLIIAGVLVIGPVEINAQRGGKPTPPPPKAAAPIDLTGYWVSIVSEDWRWRMVTPARGDYTSIPINAAAKKTADAWDPARDQAAGEQCRAPGEVPHYLPGLNPFLNEVSRVFNIPDEAARGGAATMYPEYCRQLVGKYTPLERCLRNCCGGAPGLNCDAPREEGSTTAPGR
jgi:hypothetical protein